MTIRPFPFGFAYSRDADISQLVSELKWNPISLPEDGQLFASSDQPVYSHFGERFSSIWIGHGSWLSEPEVVQQDIAKITVEKLEKGGWNELHEAMDMLVGRFAAFIWDRSELRIYHDATAIRPVYFNYADGLVTSHAPLLRELREGLGKDLRPTSKVNQFKLWEETEDLDISALPPNFYIDFNAKTIHRFYPHKPLNNHLLSEDERLAKATAISRKSMEFWGSLPIDLNCALTAGLDTRLNAAAVLGSGLKLDYVTYGSRGEIDEADPKVTKSYKNDLSAASEIAQALNLNHTCLAAQDKSKFALTDDQRETLRRNTFNNHAAHFQGLYEQTLGINPSICFVGTAFGGLRDYYIPARLPLDPFSEFKTVVRAIGGFKSHRESPLTDELAEKYWQQYDLQTAVDNGYPIGNLMCIELRAGRFQSEASNCQATAFMPINPLAIRSFLEIGQAYPYPKRKNADFLHAFIGLNCPAISGFPVNQYPKHHPISVVSEEITVVEETKSDDGFSTGKVIQNRNDRLNLNASSLYKGASKWFEKRFSLETGALDIAIQNSCFIGRASTNFELFVTINNELADSTPIGLRRTPYHFHVEGLTKNDVVRVGIKSTRDNGVSWESRTIVDLLEWAELPDSSSHTLMSSSTANPEPFGAADAVRNA